MTRPALHAKSFYFIRHGESEWNVLKKFAGGQVDTPLTPLGKKQALDSQIIFKNLNPMPTHIIHSKLCRASETAHILNHHSSIPMIEHYDLREIDAGDWQGTNSQEALQKWDDGLSPENGESLDDFSARIQKTLNNILLNPNYAMPCIVAHGRILNAIDRIYDIASRPLQVKNCEILHFTPRPDKKQYPWDIYSIILHSGTILKQQSCWSGI